MENSAEAIGQFITAERKRRGLSRLTFAGLVGKAEAQVWKTETRTNRTTLRNILLLLNELGYTLTVTPITDTSSQQQESARNQ